MKGRKMGILGTALLSAGVLSACGSTPTTSGSPSHAVTVTLWTNFGTSSNEAIAVDHLVSYFNKTHPSIHIKQVAQPGSNYFALLRASMISHTAPDIATIWTGAFLSPNIPYLRNLSPYFSKSSLSGFNGMRWLSKNSTISDGVYGIPFEDQYYIGYYNKALFAKAGISSPPQDWSQLYSDAAKLKAHGITPFLYGSTSGTAGSEFYPYWSFSYMMAGSYSLHQWRKLYSGSIPWTSSTIQSQTSKWVSLHKDGYANSGVLTTTNALGAFEKGKAAMFVNGNWFSGQMQAKMGKNLAFFIPPFSNSPMHAIVGMPGNGFAITKDAKHVKQAVAFLKFLLTPQALKIVANEGLITDSKTYHYTNPLAQQLVNYAAKDHYVQYPMLDNVTATPVVNTATKQLDSAFAGDTSVSAALRSMAHTLSSIPKKQLTGY